MGAVLIWRSVEHWNKPVIVPFSCSVVGELLFYCYSFLYVSTLFSTSLLILLLCFIVIDYSSCAPLYNQPFMYISFTSYFISFPFKSTLILCGIDLKKCWKHSLAILVHIDMTASHSFWKSFSYTWCDYLFSLHPKSTGLGYRDFGGHVSTVNSLGELIECIVLLCFVFHSLCFSFWHLLLCPVFVLS